MTGRQVCLAVAVLASVAVGCARRGSASVAPGTASVAGTYSVMICREPCDFARPERALAHGHLVLEDARYPVSELPEGVRAYLARYVPYLTRIDAEGLPNACFALAKVPGARTYAGIAVAGVTRWMPDTAAAIVIPLYHSPDAGYAATLTAHAGELRGTGESWGAGTGDEPMPSDVILGRRLGPPDRSHCIRAIDAAATR